MIAPLCDAPLLTPAKRWDILKSYGIERPRLYDMGFPHNNCGGFCVRAGLSQFALLRKKFPERFEHHRQRQEQLMKEVPNAKPFLRTWANRGGDTGYLTLSEYDEMLKEQDYKAPGFDFGGCGCFVDDGVEE